MGRFSGPNNIEDINFFHLPTQLSYSVDFSLTGTLCGCMTVIPVPSTHSHGSVQQQNDYFPICISFLKLGNLSQNPFNRFLLTSQYIECVPCLFPSKDWQEKPNCCDLPSEMHGQVEEDDLLNKFFLMEKDGMTIEWATKGVCCIYRARQYECLRNGSEQFRRLKQKKSLWRLEEKKCF